MEAIHNRTPTRVTHCSLVASSPRPVPHWEPTTCVPAFYSAPSHRAAAKTLRRRPIDEESDLAALSLQIEVEKENNEFNEELETAPSGVQSLPSSSYSLSTLYSPRVKFHALYWGE